MSRLWLLSIILVLVLSVVHADPDNTDDGNFTAPPIMNATSTNNGTEGGSAQNETSPMGESSNGDDSTTAVSPSPLPKLPIQNMYINTVKPALGSTSTETVYSDGAFVSTFNSCTLDTSVNSSDCFVDDVYNDRLEFQFTFQYDPALIRAALDSRPPSITTPSFASSIASPVVIKAQVNDDDTTASVIILYNCEPHNHGVVPIRLLLHFGNNSDTDNLSIFWQKSCESGVNSKILYGYLSQSSSDGTSQQHEFGGDDSPLVVVNPSDVSTEFFLKLDVPGAQQAVLSPYISSSSDDVVITVRGIHPQGYVLEGLNLISFSIGYECLRQEEATIDASIAIPPFQNITATWKKDCGGKAASSIQVGSQEGGFDIVDDGQPTPRYMVAIENIGTEHSEEHLHLPGNQSAWTFYIKNADDVSTASQHTAMHIGRLSATVEQPDVLFSQSPIVFAWEAGNWQVKQVSSFPLEAGDTLKVVMPLVCRSLGESRVLITIPVLGYKQLEFGVAKECTHVGKALHSGEFVFTVGRLFWGAVLIAVCVLALAYVRRRRAKTAGFEPVSTTER